MTRLARVLVPLVLLAPLAAAQETADELFYRAFYQETALRDFEAALATYRELVALDPGSARVQVRLGQCLAALGRRDEAQAAFERALALDPGDARAKAALEQLTRPSGEDELLENVRGTIQRMVSGDRDQALKDLGAYGVRALPALSEGLRSPMAEVVDLCAKAVVNLVRKGSPAAEEELVRAFNDPEVLLRESITVHLYEGVPPVSAVWARVTDIPERAARDWAERGYFRNVVGSLRSRHPEEEPMPPEEEATLRAILEDARAGGSTALRQRALELVGLYHPRLSAEGREVVEGLLRAAVDDPALLFVSWKAASEVPGLFEPIRDRFLPYLRTFPAEARVGGGLAGSLLSSGRLTPGEYVQALDLDNRDLRVAAWEGLEQRLAGSDAFPAGLAERMPRVIEDVVQELARVSGARLDFDRRWSRFPIREEDLPLVWRAQVHGNSLHDSALHRGRRQVLRRLFAGTGDPSAQALRLYEGLERQERRVLLNDLAQLDPMPPLLGFARTVVAGDDVGSRGRAYELLVSMHRRGFGDAIAERPAHLIEDVLDDDGPYQEATLLLLARGDLSDCVVLRGTLADDLAAGAAEDFRPELAVATLLRAQGVDECRDLLERRYSPALYVGREALLAERADVLMAVLEHVGRDLPAPDAGLWAALAEAASGMGPLLREMLVEVELDELSTTEASAVIRIGLQAGPSSDPTVLRKLLQNAGERDLGVEPALLLPYVRHQYASVRKAATDALDMLQRYESYRRAVASFGSDARLRAVERIRTNAASPEADLRRAAAYAIAALGDPDGVALLLDLVEDADAAVRAAALASLEKMGGVSAADDGR